MKINTIVVDGLQLSKAVYEASQRRFVKVGEKLLKGHPPRLAALVSSHRPDSDNFIKNQIKKYKEYGFDLELVEFTHSTSLEKMLHTVNLLNRSSNIHGIQMHLPFPEHLKKHSQRMLDSMATEKDVECLTTRRFDHMLASRLDKPLDQFDLIAPCTFLSCLHVLEKHEIDIKGKKAVVLGNGYVTGCPIAIMLQKKGASLTQCDRKTKGIPDLVEKADIIISATGVPDPFCADLVKPGAVVLDLGFCFEDGRFRGDIQTSRLIGKAALVSPVPKGIGPITTAMVIRNLVLLWEAQVKQTSSYSYTKTFSSDSGAKKKQKPFDSKDHLAGTPSYSL